MDFGYDKAIMNVAGDRLSILPDELIHKILSFIGIKHAIGTSVFSSRWRFIWTSMPYLNFSSQDFSTSAKLSEFVSRVLSCRNNQAEVSSVKLSFFEFVSQVFLERILNRVFSHNVQQLTVSFLFREKIDFSLDPLRSQSLKYLRLSGRPEGFGKYTLTLASTWELPSLTTLHLDYVTLPNDNTDKGIGLFSKCTNLKDLTLNNFRIMASNEFSILHPQLSNLTIEKGHWALKVVNVVAPQLKNLSIKNHFGQHLISAPNLVSLLFKSCEALHFFTDDLCSLEVDLCFKIPEKDDASNIVGLLNCIHNVKFLTLNLELVEFLSSCMELISPQAFPFANLKSLKIYPSNISSNEEGESKVNMSTKVKNYLLDGSPSATFTMVSHKEVRAFRNAVSAQNLMAILRVMLDKENTDNQTNRTHKYGGKAPMELESHELKRQEQGKAQPVEKMQLHMNEKMAQMKNCWEGLGLQIDEGKAKTCDIISMLRDIEVLLLKELPASRRDKFQACFSGLCADVNTLVKKVIDSMRIQQSQLNDCFHELASISQLPP